jgi:hypothetical protein
MREIDYFTEKKLVEMFSYGNRGVLSFYNNSVYIPSFIKDIFKDYNRESVIQGYKGHEVDGSTGDSEKLEAKYGLQEVRFWMGWTKHALWSPITGWPSFAVGRLFGATQWKSCYFDEITGQFLSQEKGEAARRLNELGNEHHQAGRYEQALVYYQNAYLNNSGNSHEVKTIYNNGIIKARAELDAIELKGEADTAFSEGRYADAKVKYQAAYNKSAVAREKDKYTAGLAKAQVEIEDQTLRNEAEADYIAGRYVNAKRNADQAVVRSAVQARKNEYATIANKAQLEITAKAAFEQAERLYSSGDYDGALNKYREAHTTSRVIAVKNTYNNGITKARAELDAIVLKGEGDTAFNEGRYADAKAKYQAAHTKSTVVREKEKYTAGITRAEVEIEARLAEARGDSIVAAANESLLEGLKEALAEYRQASERSMIKENKDRCLGKVEDLELMITIKESEEQFRQDQDSREQIELSTVIIKSLQEFEEELTKKVIEESRKTYSHELYRKGLDHKERGDEEYDAEDEGAAHEEYRSALGKFKEAIKCGKPEGIITALRELREAFSNLDVEEDVSDTDRVLDELGGVITFSTKSNIEDSLEVLGSGNFEED